MTAQYVIDAASRMRPTGVAASDLAGFLLKLDTEYAEMMGVPAPTDTSTARTLLLPDNYVNLYQFYLMFLIDVEKGDKQHHETDSKLFVILDRIFRAAYRREHEPPRSAPWQVTPQKNEAPVCPFCKMS